MTPKYSGCAVATVAIGEFYLKEALRLLRHSNMPRDLPKIVFTDQEGPVEQRSYNIRFERIAFEGDPVDPNADDDVRWIEHGRLSKAYIEVYNRLLQSSALLRLASTPDPRLHRVILLDTDCHLCDDRVMVDLIEMLYSTDLVFVAGMERNLYENLNPNLPVLQGALQALDTRTEAARDFLRFLISVLEENPPGLDQYAINVYREMAMASPFILGPEWMYRFQHPGMLPVGRARILHGRIPNWHMGTFATVEEALNKNPKEVRFSTWTDRLIIREAKTLGE